MSRSSTPSRSRSHDFSALSTSLGVALTLFLMGVLVAGAMLVRDLRLDWMSSMKVEVVLMDGGLSEGEVDRWLTRLQEDAAVGAVEYVDPETASRELEAALGEPFMDFLGEAPLPPVMELSLNRHWMQQEGLVGLQRQAEEWGSLEGVSRVDYPESLLFRLERGFEEWTLPGMCLMLALMAVVVAQIMNVVRLSVFGRRFLIRSMELVGAPPSKIRRPFILEAMGYGFVGALLAYSAVAFVLSGMRSFLPDALGHWGVKELLVVLACQLFVGLILTGLSARWAVSRYFGARLDKLV